jgi:hypothetical protein
MGKEPYWTDPLSQTLDPHSRRIATSAKTGYNETKQEGFMQYLGKTGIAWLSYKKNYIGTENKICYLFPRYIKQEDDLYEEVADGQERIDVYIPQSQEKRFANDVVEEYGNLINVKFNHEPAIYRENAYPSVKYNPDFPDSEIEIYRFRERGFIQILETVSDFDSAISNKYIETDTPLYTNELLIRTKDGYYGPVYGEIEKSGKNQDIIALSSKKESQYMLARYAIDEIDKKCIEITDEDERVRFIFIRKDSLSAINPINKSIDFIGDEILTTSLISALKTANGVKPYTKNEIREIKNAISDSLVSFTDIELTENRKKRLLNMLDKMFDQDRFLLLVISYVFENNDLLKKLSDKIYNDHFDTIEEKIRDFSEIKEKVANLQKRLEQIRVNENVLIEESKKRNREEEQKAEKRIDGLKKEIQTLENEKQQLGEIIGEGKEIEKLIKEKNDLNEKVKKTKSDCEKYDKDKILLEEQLKQLLTDYENNAMILTRQIDRKLLNHVLQTIGSEDPDKNKPTPFNTKLLNLLPADKIIERIGADLQNANRDVSRNDVVNYLICIMQGFITTLAGEPGTGKTSLCTLLAKSLGLARQDSNSRFVDISVERGWTSHKDFIGYYNPLTKTMEKSNNRVFDALYRIKDEDQTNYDAPFLILLDEANLSPIEHYWAAFLRFCDSDSAYSYSLDLGAKEPWNIPKHLRFLATVNFDHTTEELSPRFLDRSWIITLKPNGINAEISNNAAVPNQETIISYSVLRDSFVPNDENLTSTDVISKKWTKIQNIFMKNNTPVMPRNQKMVRSYCVVASQYMDMQTMETQFAPLDYAISQKILPIINGAGEQYKKLLTDLKAVCDGMPLCLAHIDRIIKAADENLGFYQFFAK